MEHSALLSKHKHLAKCFTREKLRHLYKFCRCYYEEKGGFPTYWDYINDKHCSNSFLSQMLSHEMELFVGKPVKVDEKREDLHELLSKMNGNWSDIDCVMKKLDVKHEKIDIRESFDRFGIDRSYIKFVPKEFYFFYSSDRRYSNFAKSIEVSTPLTDDNVDFLIHVRKLQIIDYYNCRGVDVSFILETQNSFVITECGKLEMSEFLKYQIHSAEKATLALRKIEWCFIGVKQLPNHSTHVHSLNEKTVEDILSCSSAEKVSIKLVECPEMLLYNDIRKYVK